MPDTQYTLDEFIETLIREKNYQTLTTAMHDELKKDLLDRVQDFLIAKTIARLTDEQANELSALLDTNPEGTTLQQFIAKCIPDAETFIGETLFKFRQTYLGLI